jgi:hypothetical protein
MEGKTLLRVFIFVTCIGLWRWRLLGSADAAGAWLVRPRVLVQRRAHGRQ